MTIMTKSNNWAALPPKKCAFQPPNQCPRPNRDDLEKKTSGAGACSIYKIRNHTPS